jgi:hypothetical protein
VISLRRTDQGDEAGDREGTEGDDIRAKPWMQAYMPAQRRSDGQDVVCATTLFRGTGSVAVEATPASCRFEEVIISKGRRTRPSSGAKRRRTPVRSFQNLRDGDTWKPDVDVDV